MKILAFSDSHGDTQLMYEILEILGNKIQMVLFLGDCVDDIMDYTYICEDVDVHYAAGNCETRYFEPSDKVIEAAGKKIFITHGHKYAIKSGHDVIVSEAKSRGVGICLYGHSHSPEIFEESGIFFMNPGSISFPRGVSGHPTYGIIDIAENGDVSGKIISVEDGIFRELRL